MNRDLVKTAKIFKAFSVAIRLEILDLLKNGEECACDLLEKLDLTQSGLSYHMKILIESGIVTAREDGKWVYYT
ncbi:transcriptional regulator, ArsR family, partial [Streptococcus dysgalactiae subsp. equisimilis SK1249]